MAIAKQQQVTLFARAKEYAQQAKSISSSALRSANVLLNKYPPVKAFVYTAAATAAIPVTIFTGYSASTLAGLTALAGTGIAVVQGGFLAFGAFVLSWFLVAAFVIACIVTFWFTLAYFAVQVARRIEAGH